MKKKEPDVFPNKGRTQNEKATRKRFWGLENEKTEKKKKKTEPGVFRKKKPGQVFWLAKPRQKENKSESHTKTLLLLAKADSHAKTLEKKKERKKARNEPDSKLLRRLRRRRTKGRFRRLEAEGVYTKGSNHTETLLEA